MKCDVSKEQDIKEAVEGAVKKFGRLDVMVSTRGRGGGEEAMGKEEEEREREKERELTWLHAFVCWCSST